MSDCHVFTSMLVYYVPFTLAVLVQLYRIANSPNTLAGPMVHNFCSSFVTSTFPSEKQIYLVSMCGDRDRVNNKRKSKLINDLRNIKDNLAWLRL